jgi:hypothetical protein
MLRVAASRTLPKGLMNPVPSGASLILHVPTEEIIRKDRVEYNIVNRIG